MGVTNSNKTVSAAHIDCGDPFEITLSLVAEPDITSNPTDIVLILDRSRSMAGSPLANLKNGAKKFIEIIDEATDGSQDGQIGNGSHIGIVSFSTTATQDTGLITSVADLNAAVNALTADGLTNHADAFTKAVDLFDPASTNEKVLVMFTDGVTTAGDPPNPVATAAKAQGIVIYVIGLSGNGGIDEQALSDWASDPDSAYLAITPDDAELEDLFEDLANNISKPGATDIVITDTVSPCFKVLSISSPTKGSASIVSETKVEWKIDELGKTTSEGASLTFTVEHVGACSGEVEVNEAVTYSDNENNVVTFPSPTVQVDCDVDVCLAACPTPVDITVNGCEDTVEFDAGDIVLDPLGRILQLSVTLQNVCPNKRVALAVILTEIDEKCVEHKRGLQTFVVPAHTRESCRDVTVNCIRFVLPALLDDSPACCCDERRFKVRFLANYIDSNFQCPNTN